jgi:hypothetical protein
MYVCMYVKGCKIWGWWKFTSSHMICHVAVDMSQDHRRIYPSVSLFKACIFLFTPFIHYMHCCVTKWPAHYGHFLLLLWLHCILKYYIELATDWVKQGICHELQNYNCPCSLLPILFYVFGFQAMWALSRAKLVFHWVVDERPILWCFLANS